MEMHVFDGTALGSLTEGEAEERNKAGTGNMVLRKGMHMVLGLLSGNGVLRLQEWMKII